MNLVIIGPQASGKGTQAKVIAEKLGYVHLSTGAMFRAEIEKGTELGKLAASLINDGGSLVPDNINNAFVSETVLKLNDQGKKVILDGYPRNIGQATFAIETLAIDKVILIELSEEVTIKRLQARYHCPKCKKEYNTLYPSLKPKQEGKCDVCNVDLVQRSDDSKVEFIKNRLKTYHEETEPMFELFKDKIIKINGEQPIEKVTGDIIKNL
jgi:adenylate kinase